MESSLCQFSSYHLTFLKSFLKHFEAVALDVVSIGQDPVLGGLTEDVRDKIYQQTEKTKSRTELGPCNALMSGLS